MKKIITFFAVFLLISASAPAAFAKDFVLDNAGLLTSNQISYITSEIERINSVYNIEVVVATTNEYSEKSAQEQADDIFDYGGYGAGSDYSGVLMFIDMNERYIHISTAGSCIDTFTDKRIDRALDKITPSMKNEDYYEAVKSFLSVTEEYQRNPKAGLSDVNFGLITLISLVAGFLIAGIWVAVIAGKNKSKMIAQGTDYIVSGSFELTRNEDIFAGTHTTRRYIPPPSSSSGGSSTHSGSSGRSHGGGGRGF